MATAGEKDDIRQCRSRGRVGGSCAEERSCRSADMMGHRLSGPSYEKNGKYHILAVVCYVKISGILRKGTDSATGPKG